MKIHNSIFEVDLTSLIAHSILTDSNIRILGKIIAEELRETAFLSRLNTIYARIDELDEEMLDILAYDLHADWYKDDYPIEVKRAMIKDSVRVHKRLGTKYAVETALRPFNPSVTVKEWFEYGGDPYFFRIYITDWFPVSSMIADFIKVLYLAKRESAWLERIFINNELDANNNLFVGSAANVYTQYTISSDFSFWQNREIKAETDLKVGSAAISHTQYTLYSDFSFWQGREARIESSLNTGSVLTGYTHYTFHGGSSLRQNRKVRAETNLKAGTAFAGYTHYTIDTEGIPNG